MLKIKIPGTENLQLKHLVLDFNGTVAEDGHLLPGVKEKLEILQKNLQIHILTADTYGSASGELKNLPVRLEIIPAENQDQAKEELIKSLGEKEVAAIGNGRNDRLMLKKSTLGIMVIQKEGAAVEAFWAADVLCLSIQDALDLFLYPQRLKATLRK